MAKESLKRPSGPVNIDPFQSIHDQASFLKDKAFECNTVEGGQAYIRKLDEILRNLSALQTKVGALRKQSSAVVSSLRQASPKGKPAEGSVLSINGVNHVFQSGKYYPIEHPSHEEEHPTE